MKKTRSITNSCRRCIAACLLTGIASVLGACMEPFVAQTPIRRWQDMSLFPIIGVPVGIALFVGAVALPLAGRRFRHRSWAFSVLVGIAACCLTALAVFGLLFIWPSSLGFP